MAHSEKSWQDAKKRDRLSNTVINRAKKIGLNPKKLGGLANHQQEPWKEPLPHFIQSLYKKRFGTDSIPN